MQPDDERVFQGAEREEEERLTIMGMSAPLLCLYGKNVLINAFSSKKHIQKQSLIIKNIFIMYQVY